MALNKAPLKLGIKNLLTDMEAKNEDAKDEFAERLSTLIDVYVKTATVNVTVVTTGTATAQTGTGTGTLS